MKPLIVYLIITFISTFIFFWALFTFIVTGTKAIFNELNKPDTTVTCKKGKCDTIIVTKTHKF